MLHFCSCFNPTFSSNACDTISEKQPKACSLAFSRASPFLVCGDYDWNGKFLELVSVIHRLLPAVSPKGERHAAPFFPVLSQSFGPLAKICQSAGDTPTLHSQQKEEFWVDPPRTLFCVCVWVIKVPSLALLLGQKADRACLVCAATCPETPAEEWQTRLVKSGFNKSGYLVI